jgi:hypothetical protein
VVLTYNEDLQQLTVHTIDPNRLAPLVAGRMGVVMADEEDFKLDDELRDSLELECSIRSPWVSLTSSGT